jgi:hypothetical protein
LDAPVSGSNPIIELLKMDKESLAKVAIEVRFIELDGRNEPNRFFQNSSDLIQLYG